MSNDKNDADVIKLSVKRRINPPDGSLMLVKPPFGKCKHYGVSFEIDQEAGDCKCLQCGERVTAIFVLTRLMHQESRWMKTREAHQDEMKRLNERSRTKCQHCGEITRISHR